MTLRELDRSVFLLNQAVEVLEMAQLDVQPCVRDQAMDGDGVGATLFEGDFLSQVVQINGL